uniref:Family with sequence similarity 169 member A n=1 Tax=Varanus komodoensis TaxID=61221 RepID=A0A8D2INJ5_VARKO
MAFPVDLLDNYSHEDLESSGEDYLSDLRCGDPDNPEFLSLANNIPICLSTVGFVPLYGGEERHKVLALFVPEDPLTGSICSAFLTQSYQLPVLDTMFVRKKHRGKDLGLLMLEDFVDSFMEDTLGLRFPLTSFMHAACQKYFERYPGDHDLLWEVEGIGHLHQRTPVASILQRESLKYKGMKALGNDAGLVWEERWEYKCNILIINIIVSLYFFPFSELNAMLLSTRSRSNHLKRPKLGKRMQESEIPEGEDVTLSQASENRLEPFARVFESSEDLEDEMEENADESAQEVLVENQKQPVQETPQLCPLSEKQDDKEDIDVEPLNGELMEDAIKVSIVTEGQTAGEVIDGESKLQSDSSEEATLTLLVPLILDSSVKSPEYSDDNISDKVENMADAEMSPEEEHPAVQRKSALVPNADPVAAAEKEERPNNGLSNSIANEGPEDTTSENVSPNTTSSLEEQSEEGGSDSPEVPGTLGQGALVMVELEDISYQQHTEGQKNQLDEQSEESAEPASERAADSSSEEAEIEVPIVDRRTLRRKAKGYKGPPKKKGKLI